LTDGWDQELESFPQSRLGDILSMIQAERLSHGQQDSPEALRIGRTLLSAEGQSFAQHHLGTAVVVFLSEETAPFEQALGELPFVAGLARQRHRTAQGQLGCSELPEPLACQSQGSQALNRIELRGLARQLALRRQCLLYERDGVLVQAQVGIDLAEGPLQPRL